MTFGSKQHWVYKGGLGVRLASDLALPAFLPARIHASSSIRDPVYRFRIELSNIWTSLVKTVRCHSSIDLNNFVKTFFLNSTFCKVLFSKFYFNGFIRFHKTRYQRILAHSSGHSFPHFVPFVTFNMRQGGILSRYIAESWAAETLDLDHPDLKFLSEFLSSHARRIERKIVLLINYTLQYSKKHFVHLKHYFIN